MVHCMLVDQMTKNLKKSEDKIQKELIEEGNTNILIIWIVD